jgi:adenylate cyclase
MSSTPSKRQIPILVYRHEGKQITVPLEREGMIIGRAEENNLTVSDRSISRRHARIHLESDLWKITDLNSRNGVVVNGERCASKVLHPGDEFQLGAVPFRFLERPSGKSGPVPSESPAPDQQKRLTVRPAKDFVTLANLPDMGAATSAADSARLRRLLAIVTDSSQALLSSVSLDRKLSTVLDLVFEHLPVERGFIMLWDDEFRELVVRCERNDAPLPSGDSEVHYSTTIVDKVFREKVAVLIKDAQSDARFDSRSIKDLEIRSAMAAPLCQGETCEGLIYVDTPHRVKAFDDYDLDLLSALSNHAAIAITQSRMQAAVTEQKLLRKRLERYHSPAVVERIASRMGSGMERMADEVEASVLFADVVGFTPRCESMQPREVADILNLYFSTMTEIVFSHQGTLDKYIGDCLMAVFGAPIALDDHARRALDAAIDMREALHELNETQPENERLEFRVGIHSGRVVAGDIGSLTRSDYTVLGSTVNVAARLESIAEPGQIVVSGATREATKDHYATHPLGESELRGISRRVSCYEVLGRKSRS